MVFVKTDCAEVALEAHHVARVLEFSLMHGRLLKKELQLKHGRTLGVVDKIRQLLRR